MMYGFGDDPQPYAESVELLEDLVVQYITDMVKIIFKKKRRI
jgi:transcription initiation factor TFIID subunit 13